MISVECNEKMTQNGILGGINTVSTQDRKVLLSLYLSIMRCSQFGNYLENWKVHKCHKNQEDFGKHIQVRD